MTSRPESAIVRALFKYKPVTIATSDEENMHDLRLLIQTRVRVMKLVPEMVVDEVTSIMMSKASGLFSYTTLLLDQFASGSVRVALPYSAASFSSLLPSDLGELYTQTMMRVAASVAKQADARKHLSAWVGKDAVFDIFDANNVMRAIRNMQPSSTPSKRQHHNTY